MRKSPSTDVTSLDDLELWRAFKRGDRKAYSRIYQLQVRMMHSYGIKLCPDGDLIKDCIQELFYYLWEHRHGLGDTDNIRRYLFTALRREIITQLRRATNRQLPDYALFTPPYETEWIEQQTARQNHQCLRAALEVLPGRQKEAILLKYYQEMNATEIAQVMNIRRRAVYKLQAKAIRNLQNLWPLPLENPAFAIR